MSKASKVVWRGDNPTTEEIVPDAIGYDSSHEWVFRVGQIFCQFQTSRSFYCSPRPSVEMAGAARMSRAGATRWLALALALSCVARGAHAGTPKPEPIVAKEFSFSDELDDAFYAKADQLSITAAERFARAMARFRASGGVTTVTDSGHQQRTLLDAVGVRDPRHLDVDRLWSPRRSQGPEWMRFPVGLDDSGQVVDLDLKEGSQQGMGMHSLFIGTTGAGKSEGIITEVASMALTHSPEVANVVFFDFKLKQNSSMPKCWPSKKTTRLISMFRTWKSMT